jgi:hypothetical protein
VIVNLFVPVVAVLKKMVLSLLGEKIVAYMAFGLLTYLAGLTKTSIDNEVVSQWKKAYYNEAKPVDPG